MTQSSEGAPLGEIGSAQADLAFMRTLVQSGSGQFQKTFGQSYLAAGLCYGAELLGACVQGLGFLRDSAVFGVSIHVIPTVVFIALVFWITWPTRKARPSAFGRSMRAVFVCIGTTNLCIAAVIASVALREQSLTTWLIYPCTVYALQGAAWLIYYSLRRRVWQLLAALGWFACAVGMGWFVTYPPAFLAIATIGLMGLMAVPGWLLARSAALD